MTAPQWTPEIVVDLALATRLIETQFPEFRGAPIERYGAGWDNAAFLVDGSALFRFPQRTLSAPLLLYPQIVVGDTVLTVMRPCADGRLTFRSRGRPGPSPAFSRRRLSEQ